MGDELSSGPHKMPDVSTVFVALIALVVGVVIGVIVYGQVRSRAAVAVANDPIGALPDDEPVVPDGVSAILNVLRSGAAVIGPHDQVLQSTSQARTMGVVRGSRIAIPTVLEIARFVRADGTIHSQDLQLTRGKGEAPLFLSVRAAPIGDGLILILAEDRTAARRVEETRRDFVANVSHELKTPIGAISLLTETVMDAADDPEAVRNFTGRMQTEGKRLSELVGQIIELSRLQADDPLLAADEVAVDALIAEAVDRCRTAAQNKDINLSISGEPGCHVMGSAEQLTTAIVNLVENAIIYSDHGGRVAVAARRVPDADGPQVEISVSDSGIGIAPKEIQRIFERFYRVDYARSRANGGTGLGLSIVKHIASAHGGTVNVWSQEGQGSTFTIRIPEHGPEDHLQRETVPVADEELS